MELLAPFPIHVPLTDLSTYESLAVSEPAALASLVVSSGIELAAMNDSPMNSTSFPMVVPF